jgi:hypothetical protein
MAYALWTVQENPVKLCHSTGISCLSREQFEPTPWKTSLALDDARVAGREKRRPLLPQWKLTTI